MAAKPYSSYIRSNNTGWFGGAGNYVAKVPTTVVTQEIRNTPLKQIAGLTWYEVKYVPLLDVASSKRRFRVSSVGDRRMLVINPCTPRSVLICAQRNSR